VNILGVVVRRAVSCCLSHFSMEKSVQNENVFLFLEIPKSFKSPQNNPFLSFQLQKDHLLLLEKEALHACSLTCLVLLP